MASIQSSDRGCYSQVSENGDNLEISFGAHVACEAAGQDTGDLKEKSPSLTLLVNKSSQS